MARKEAENNDGHDTITPDGRYLIAHVGTPAGAIPRRIAIPERSSLNYIKPKPQRVITDYLEGTLRVAEDNVEKLGKPRDAWRTIEVHWDGITPRPGIGHGMEAKRVLGKEYKVAERSTLKVAQLSAWRTIERAARRLRSKEDLDERQAIARVLERDPALYEKYEAQRFKALPILAQMEAWRHAEVGALMASALERLDDPLVVFSAGIVEGEYHQYNHQQKRLNRELQRQHRKIQAAASRARQKAGRAKAGKVAPHTALVRATVRHLKIIGRQPTADAVLLLLARENPNADALDSVRDALCPVLLPDSEPFVNVEHEKVIFRFRNRSERAITLGRFRNMVSDAAHIEDRDPRP